MAPKKLALKLHKKYITKGGHIVETCHKCWCGNYGCTVRKNGKYIIPRQSFINSKTEGNDDSPCRCHYNANGRLNTVHDDSSRKQSSFDVVALWEG